MIHIVPIDNNLFDSKYFPKINTNKVYCVDIDLMTLLISKDDYPHKKDLSVKKILSFIQWFECNMDEDNTLNISWKYLKSNLDKNYKKYMDILADNKIITPIKNESGKYYQTGVETKKYRILEKWVQNNELCLVYFEDNKRSIEVRIDDNIKDLNIDKRHIYTVTSKLKVNYTDALKDEILNWKEKGFTTNRLRKRLNKLFSTKDFRFIKKGPNVDRVYHSFSNISKISRKHLNIPMNNIDIKNSQPLILVTYLLDENLPIDKTYQEDCESGEFYLKFYSTRGEDYSKDEEEWRSNVKVGLYKSIFFNFNESSLYNKKFRELYPKTWNSLKVIKTNGQSLSKLLQNKEAEIFNSIVPKNSKYFFTLFDAIYYSDKDDTPGLLEDINSFFNQKNIKVKMDIKLWS